MTSSRPRSRRRSTAVAFSTVDGHLHVAASRPPRAPWPPGPTPSTARRSPDEPTGQRAVRRRGSALSSDPPSRWNGSSSAAVPPGPMTSGGRSTDVVDRLVPLDVGRPVDLEGVDGSERGPGAGEPPPVSRGLDRPALGLQAPDAHPEDRRSASAAEVDEALGAGRPPLGPVRLAEGPGRQHAELPAHLVLAGRRPVGVEDVPLVEDGVGHRSGRREAVLSSWRVERISCRWRSRPLLPGLFEERVEGLVPGREASRRPEPLQVVEGVAADPQPSRCRGSTVHRPRARPPPAAGSAASRSPRDRLGRRTRRRPG